MYYEADFETAIEVKDDSKYIEKLSKYTQQLSKDEDNKYSMKKE